MTADIHTATRHGEPDSSWPAPPMSAVRDLIDAGGRLDRDDYRHRVREGTFLPLAEEGAGLAEAAAIAEERGRTLQPAPFVAANVVASAVRSYGSDVHVERVLAPLRQGDVIVTLAWTATADGGHSATATADGGGFVLDGHAELVQYGRDADWLLVTADGGRGPVQFLVPTAAAGVRVTPTEALDGTRGLTRVDFDSVRLGAETVLGSAEHGARQEEEQLRLLVLLSAAETVGAMDRLFGSALDYARRRHAFGRPIGSFQVVKHALVDASLALETSKALIEALIEAMDDGADDAGEIASIVKSFIGRNGIELAHIAWQTFGGIAYTWENDFHLYLRRITSDSALFGDVSWHHRRINRLHEEAGA